MAGKNVGAHLVYQARPKGERWFGLIDLGTPTLPGCIKRSQGEWCTRTLFVTTLASLHLAGKSVGVHSFLFLPTLSPLHIAGNSKSTACYSPHPATI